MTYEIIKATVYQFASGKQCQVKTNKGRLSCPDESLFDTLKLNEGKSLDLVVDGNIITGIEGKTPSANPQTPPAKPQEAARSAERPPQTKSKPNPQESVSPPAAEGAESEENIPESPYAYVNVDVGQNEPDPPANESKQKFLFPPLRASEIEVRVAQVFSWGVRLLLYKDARCDMKRLDAAFGPFGWRKDYRSIDGKLFCAVSVRDPDTGEWIEKTDVGTESNTEAEKGQASDAFKRACVCWGSGRELYDPLQIIVRADGTVIKEKDKRLICDDKFIVSSINYDDDRRIKTLCIYSCAKQRVVFKYFKK